MAQYYELNDKKYLWLSDAERYNMKFIYNELMDYLDNLGDQSVVKPLNDFDKVAMEIIIDLVKKPTLDVSERHIVCIERFLCKVNKKHKAYAPLCDSSTFTTFFRLVVESEVVTDTDTINYLHRNR